MIYEISHETSVELIFAAAQYTSENLEYYAGATHNIKQLVNQICDHIEDAEDRNNFRRSAFRIVAADAKRSKKPLEFEEGNSVHTTLYTYDNEWELKRIATENEEGNFPEIEWYEKSKENEEEWNEITDKFLVRILEEFHIKNR